MISSYRDPRPRKPDAAVIEAARALVEGTTLSLSAVAAQVGLCRETVTRWRDRHGWVRPAGARVPGRAGFGHRIGPEVVEAARALVEDTALPSAAIAQRMGVGRATLGRWIKKGGWRRPPEAPTFLRPRRDGRAQPARYRTLPRRPYAADAVGAARILLTGTLLSQAAIADRIGVSPTWVFQTLHRHGWARPALPPGSRCFAGSLRTAPVAETGDRRGRPYGPEVVAEARRLYGTTGLSTRFIAARVKVSAVAVARWARDGGWARPRDMPDAHGRVRRRRRMAGGVSGSFHPGASG